MERQVSKKGIITLSILCILMIIAIAILGGFLGLYVSRNRTAENTTESVFEQNYYTLLDSVLNMENNLSKMRIARGMELQTQLLKNTCVNSQTASQCLSNMSFSDHSMQNLIKFCNQAGDYCNYIFEKVIGGEEITEEEYGVIDELYNVSYQLGVKLSSIKENIVNSGYRFVDSVGKADDAFALMIDGLRADNFEYPSLIYDGPFSDGLVDREVKGIVGNQITKEQGEKLIEIMFDGRSFSSIEYIGEVSVRFDVLAYNVILADGSESYVELTKQGGMPVMIDSYENVDSPTLTEKQGIDIAEKYAERVGFKSMKAVWSCVSGSILYVNLCYEQNGIICYPDMVKLKISLQTGNVLGLEATTYLINHDSNRKIGDAVITETQAIDGKYGSMKVDSVRLVVIPVGNNGEKLAYEVYGKIGDTMFFVYVDAINGKQLKIMQVIDSDEGMLLL